MIFLIVTKKEFECSKGLPLSQKLKEKSFDKNQKKKSNEPKIEQLVNTFKYICGKGTKDFQFVNFFKTYNRKETLKETFNMIINLFLILSDEHDLMALDTLNKALYQKYKRFPDQDEKYEKNIFHLLAKQNLGKTISNIIEANSIKKEDVFKLLKDKQGKFSNTPLVSAAIECHPASLSAMLNFYTTRINMLELHKVGEGEKENERNKNKKIINDLLHSTDSKGNNLTYHIIQSKRKALGPYGMILQIEKDFHSGLEEFDELNQQDETDSKHQTTIETYGGTTIDDKKFLAIQMCLQKFHGSTKETRLALDLIKSTKVPSKKGNSKQLILCMLALTLFRIFLWSSDVGTDAVQANSWRIENWTAQQMFCEAKNVSQMTLLDYPNQLFFKFRFIYYMIFMISPVIVYAVFIFNLCRKIYADENKQKYPRTMRILFWTNLPKEKNFLQILLLLGFSPILAALWPVRMYVLEAWSSYKYQTTNRFEWKQEATEISRDTGLIMLAEVCLEATFASILNWYLILPSNLSDLSDAGAELNVAKISFLFSVFTLSWSYTSYVADQKGEVLSLSQNPKPSSLSPTCFLFLPE